MSNHSHPSQGCGERAIALYEAGADVELWALADAVWPEAGGDLTTDIAEACYFARTSYIRAERWAEAHIWHARALVASVAAPSATTGARLLMAEFFQLTALEQHPSARKVLHEMAHLVDVADSGAPMARLYNEKIAFSYVEDGMYSDAIAHYRQALIGSESDARRNLKVRGGLAVALRLDGRDSAIPGGLTAELRSIADEAARLGFPDVLAAAEANLRWVDGSEPSWTAFELR